MNEPPKKIWLQYHGDADHPDDPGPLLDEVTWCWEKIFEHDLEYISADEVEKITNLLWEIYEQAHNPDFQKEEELERMIELTDKIPELLKEGD